MCWGWTVNGAAVRAWDPAKRVGLLEVFVGDAPDTPAMAGDVDVVEGLLRFEPRYPLRPGVRYRVVFHRGRVPGGRSTDADLSEHFELPKPRAGPPTTVAQIYPSGEHLPENQLKFYLHFSAPMSRGEAYRRIHLLDDQGREVEAPFLELGEELWDPEMQRFTLLCDPGRIKRGLKPREEVGPVLVEGQHYTLVVDREWLDATGEPLESEYRKAFDALPPDDAPLDVAAWKIEPPKAGTTEALVVRFPEPLDHSMLLRVLHVVDAGGATLPGKIDVREMETCWRFTPQAAWPAGDFQVVVDTTLEDLAGNSIGRAFDVDVFGPVQKSITSERVKIPFTVAAP